MTTPDHTATVPTRTAIDALAGPVLLEFGASWCGYCRAARPLVAEALVAHPQVRHISIEDGKGCRLGRSYQVKLWPTLVFLLHGQEVARLVRPVTADAIRMALAKIDTTP